MRIRDAFPISTAICLAVIALATARQGQVPSQSSAIRRLRSRLADMPVPEKLTRRTLNVGGKEREFFMHVPERFLVCHLADRIAGAGVVVATLPRAAENDWPKPSRPVPILVIRGTVDPMKPWHGNRDQMSADETMAFWRNQNACASDGKKWDLPDRNPTDGCHVRAERWEGKSPVLCYTTENHGHGWPLQKGRDAANTGPKTRDISAPEEFWKFFRSAARTEKPRRNCEFSARNRF